MNDWVINLQHILVREAMRTSEKTIMTKTQFSTYINELTLIADWPDEFLEKTYNYYLEKVDEAGIRLTEKVR